MELTHLICIQKVSEAFNKLFIIPEKGPKLTLMLLVAILANTK